MRHSIHRKVLLAGACLLAGVTAGGQAPRTPASPAIGSLDLAFTYSAVNSNVVASDNFWLQGGSVQLHGQFWKGLGVVADINGLHSGNMNGSGVGLDLVTATFGPRYTWKPARCRSSFYGQTLLGEAFGMNSVFPGATATATDASSMALLLGGGVNLPLTPHLAVRVLEANWLRTQLPNNNLNVQNNLRLGAGIVYRFQK